MGWLRVQMARVWKSVLKGVDIYDVAIWCRCGTLSAQMWYVYSKGDDKCTKEMNG